MSAEVGESINIVGSHFGNVQGASKVWFYPFVEAVNVNGWDDSLINVEVPEGVKDGYVHLFVEGRYSNPFEFVLLGEIETLPDTGYDECYDMDGNQIECGSAFVGQDAEYDTGCVQSFVDNEDGTVTELCTGLMWQQEDDEVERDWGEALAYCEGLELAGHSDWRLPNRRELDSLLDIGGYFPAIDFEYFPTVQSDYYWSSTTCPGYKTKAWKIRFANSVVGYHFKYDNEYVRCVR